VTETPALEMVGISKQFGAFAALQDADFLVRRGTVHGLLGENGAGKTTLMRIAYGMIQPDRGVIRVDGAEVHFGNPSAAISAGIGMVHQHPANVPAMTVAENIELGERGAYRPLEIRDRATGLAQRMAFDLDVDARVRDLSVGAQQRLEILKAIARNARILILDEPTAVLAPAEARELLEWLRGFASAGGTAIVITHKLEEARSFTDDLTVLRNGRTVLTAPATSTGTRQLAEAMLGAPAPTASGAAAKPASDVVVAQATDVTIHDDRGLVAVAHASFEVRRGEVVGVAGVEGSGHHELLLALAGRLSVAGGALSLPLRIGFVPENRHRDAVVLDFSLSENVAIHGAGHRAGRMQWKAIENRTSALLERFDVRSRGPSERMATLSGGNQQKVALAREVDARPELLVVENPTRGLDIRASAFVHAQIRSGRDAGMAVVLYSSDLDEVIESADRVLVVHAGTVRVLGRDRVAVGAAMLGLS
jgi:general nucleoside transport system ATP-binding protein